MKCLNPMCNGVGFIPCDYVSRASEQPYVIYMCKNCFNTNVSFTNERKIDAYQLLELGHGFCLAFEEREYPMFVWYQENHYTEQIIIKTYKDISIKNYKDALKQITLFNFK